MLGAARIGADDAEQAVASRTGWALAEVDRLLAVEAVVRERLDPRQALRRRWSIVKPVADAVTALEKSLGRTPSVEEIAAQAGVPPATVELVLAAIADGGPGGGGGITRRSGAR